MFSLSHTKRPVPHRLDSRPSSEFKTPAVVRLSRHTRGQSSSVLHPAARMPASTSRPNTRFVFPGRARCHQAPPSFIRPPPGTPSSIHRGHPVLWLDVVSAGIVGLPAVCGRVRPTLCSGLAAVGISRWDWSVRGRGVGGNGGSKRAD